MAGEISAVKTYRYLRLAMATVSFALLVAVVFEHSQTRPRCWQTSISAYYYTPARAILVGGLITTGVCMIVLKASTDWEDIILNVGGILAPVVAVVPTPGAGHCWSVPVEAADPGPNIVNNMWALFISGAVMLAVALLLAWKFRGRGADDANSTPPRWKVPDIVGLVVAAVLMLGAIGWLLLGRASFEAHAHNTAAVLLFVCLVGVCCLNAVGLGRSRGGSRHSRRPYANRYALIASLMLISTVAIAAWVWLVGWAHWRLWLETIILVLFAVFWVTQTQELWNPGLRDDASDSRRD